jgi:hypothetical protein
LRANLNRDPLLGDHQIMTKKNTLGRKRIAAELRNLLVARRRLNRLRLETEFHGAATVIRTPFGLWTRAYALEGTYNVFRRAVVKVADARRANFLSLNVMVPKLEIFCKTP